MDVRVFHRDREVMKNSCSRNNGGCSHLCLLKPRGRTCACSTGVKLMEDGKRCADGPMNYLIFAHRSDIRFVSFDVPYLVDVVYPFQELKNVLGVDVDLHTGLIYWTDTKERVIRRADKFGSQVKTIISQGLQTADSLAIDSNGRKIYWTDGGRNSIEVAELDGSNRKVLVWTGLDSPRGIALYYEYGYMFWSDWGTEAKIERSDMDGTNRRVIISQSVEWPNGLAIDRLENRIYWNDAKANTIESSDFNGWSRKTILTDVPYPYGIAIMGQYIYWTDWKTKALHRVDKKNAKNEIIIRDKLEGLMDIRAIQNDFELKNVCGTNNGGCSHLCLRNDRGFSCACPTGLLFENTTDPQPKICKKHPDNFIIFATGNSMTIISLDTPELRDINIPVEHMESSVALDFHWDKKLIFYTDVKLNEIRTLNMENMTENKGIVNKSLETPNGLAVDWIADNLYWTDNDYKVLEVSKLDGTCRTILISGLEEPRSIALFPAKGYLYWSDWGDTPGIERAALDGTMRKVIIDHDLGFPNGLTIDYAERRLYWTDAMKDRIDTSDLNGLHRVQIIPNAKNPFGLTQFHEFIYWTDWYKKSVMRAGKESGDNVTAVSTNYEMAMEIKAVSHQRQHGWNPCMEYNGGCSHFCFFRGHDYICACPEHPNETPCSITPSLKVNSRMPSRYPSNYDYMDYEHELPPAAPEGSSHTEAIVIGVFVMIIIIIGAMAIGFVCLKVLREQESESKDTVRESDISFHNLNYVQSTLSDEMDEKKSYRLGIFKYEKSQNRVTNVYIPEGTRLLSAPPSQEDLPVRPATHDDFEPVTLHSFA